jgi:pyruvate,orthophosphate dikinase
MAGEELITREEGVASINAAQLDQLLHPTLDPTPSAKSSPKACRPPREAAAGELVFDADEAVHLKAQGPYRDPRPRRDVAGGRAGHACRSGIITTRGGMTSHAAVVARGMGRPCVVGASTVAIDLDRETLQANGTLLHKGDFVTIDGSTGQIIKGRVPMRRAQALRRLQHLDAMGRRLPPHEGTRQRR